MKFLDKIYFGMLVLLAVATIFVVGYGFGSHPVDDLNTQVDNLKIDVECYKQDVGLYKTSYQFERDLNDILIKHIHNLNKASDP